MINRRVVLGTIIGLGLFAGGIGVGQNVNGRRHPNLEEAQAHIEKAMAKLDAAQGANEFDMAGHAGRAKEALARAYNEIKQAAMTANHH